MKSREELLSTYPGTMDAELIGKDGFRIYYSKNTSLVGFFGCERFFSDVERIVNLRGGWKLLISETNPFGFADVCFFNPDTDKVTKWILSRSITKSKSRTTICRIGFLDASCDFCPDSGEITGVIYESKRR